MISLLIGLLTWLLVFPLGGSASESARGRIVLEPEISVAQPVESDREPAPAPEPEPKPEGPVQYEANTTVLESKEHGPMLCLGGIMESYPPQCGDVPVDGWTWDAVEGEESANGTTWGGYHVRGTYEDDRFGVVKVGRFRNEPSRKDYDFSPACKKPWPSPNQSKTSHEDFEAAVTYANRQRNVSAVWVSYLDEKDPPEQRDEMLLNAAFTGRLAHHQSEIRERWGGPLCVVRYETSRRQLSAIRREVGEMPEIRKWSLWSDINEVQSYVEIGLIVLTEETEAKLRRRYGDLVKASGALQPVG